MGSVLVGSVLVVDAKDTFAGLVQGVKEAGGTATSIIA